MKRLTKWYFNLKLKGCHRFNSILSTHGLCEVSVCVKRDKEIERYRNIKNDHLSRSWFKYPQTMTSLLHVSHKKCVPILVLFLC